MNKPTCYLCGGSDGYHTNACCATPTDAVPLGQEAAWRAGVEAAMRCYDLRDRTKIDKPNLNSPEEVIGRLMATTDKITVRGNGIEMDFYITKMQRTNSHSGRLWGIAFEGISTGAPREIQQ